MASYDICRGNGVCLFSNNLDHSNVILIRIQLEHTVNSTKLQGINNTRTVLIILRTT